jgi:hypothetical protein
MGSYEGGTEVTKNNFEAIAQAILTEAAEAVTDSSNKIEASIRANRWSSKVPVKTRLSSNFQAVVVTGSRKRFWAGLAEWGTIDQAARPVVVPAAERERRAFLARAKSIGDRLPK